MNGLSYFQNLAAKAKQTTNSEEAKQIKDKLIRIGITLIVVGFLGAFICFIAFAVLAFSNVMHHDFESGLGFLFLIPFFLLIPFFSVGTIGVICLKLGLGIIIAKATTNFIDQNSYCPNCGDVVEADEKYCKKCGKPLLAAKVCEACQTENDMESKYCKNCGHKL